MPANTSKMSPEQKEAYRLWRQSEQLRCRREKAEHYRKVIKANLRTVRPYAVCRFYPWFPEDIELLLTNPDELTDKELAKKMWRTMASIRWKRHQLKKEMQENASVL